MLRVRVGDPDQVQSLCGFLERVSGRAERTTDPHLVLVELPGAIAEVYERHEVVAYILTWQALEGGCEAELVEAES